MNLLRRIITTKLILPVPTSHLTTKLTLPFSQTSRDIEHRMREQRNKNLNNKFKSLQTHFGLKRPLTISQGFSKPSSFEFSIQSLRRNSHMYPEYLLNQLNNHKSQYYEVIEKLFESLSNADNNQSLQFLQFMISWKIYRHSPEYQEILIRKIYQMKLTFAEIFRLLKVVIQIEEKQARSLIIVNLQNRLLEKIIDIEHHEYESLFRILNFMRMHDLSPKVRPEQVKGILEGDLNQGQESFFKVVQAVLLRNLDQIPLANLVEMIVHYANNIKENHDDKIEILSKVEGKVLENLTFFTHDQLIAVMYSYLKTETFSERLVEQFVTRVQLLYFQISWENKRKILSLASSLPYNKFLTIVGLSIHEVLKGKKVIFREGKVENDPNSREVEYQLLPSIYMASYETNLITPQLVDKIQPKILENIFNYKSQDIGLITWLFTITPPSMVPKRQNRDLLYTKVQSIITGGFNSGTFTLKDISMVVWSLCNYGGKSNFVYKQHADFWKNIEFYIQERIGNRKEERLFNGCCQILWAYLNNKPLTIKTINMITDVIVESEKEGKLGEEMFNFQLVILTSFYYSLRGSLPNSIMQFVEELVLKYFALLLPEMDYLEIMKILKFVLNDSQDKMRPNVLSKEVWGQIIDQFHLDIQRIEYSYIMGVVGYTIISPFGAATDPKAVEVVTKLMARKKRLEQLKPINAQTTT